MNAAISVKSPFSHNALFGLIETSFGVISFPLLLTPCIRPESLSGLQLWSAPAHRSMPKRRHDLLGRPREANPFAREPENFAESAGDLVDAFSEILCNVKLSGAVFFSAEFSAPWGVSMPASSIMAARLAPGANHIVLYHLLIEGQSVVEMLDGQEIGLEPGDIVIFPHEDAHHMSSGKDA